MTPPKGATEILPERVMLDSVVQALPTGRDRTRTSPQRLPRRSAGGSGSAPPTCSTSGATSPTTTRSHGVGLQYQEETGIDQRLLYEFLDPELKKLPRRHRKFRANRSMRDVEPSVNLWLRTLDGDEIEGDEE